MKINVLCLLVSLGAVSLASAVEPASSSMSAPGAVDGEALPDEGPSCLGRCEIQEEWCAAECANLGDECPIDEAGQPIECVTPKAACEQTCSNALAACQQQCESE